jgi:hypothetical protein
LNYTINDIQTSSVAKMKSDLIKGWTAHRLKDQTVVQLIPFPRVTSTDGFQTTANQTPLSTPDAVDATYNTPEKRRVAVAAWMRAPASAGLGNSAAADAPGLVDYFIDPAPIFEYNAAGVQEIGGGRWKPGVIDFSAPSPGAGLSSSGAVVTDTRQAWTVNQFSDLALYVTGGTGAGQLYGIKSNTATTITLGNSLSPALNSTSTYIVGHLASQEGTHPEGWVHIAVAALVPASVFRL